MTLPLLTAAMLLLPFDIAVRRLAIDRSDLARLGAWVTGATRAAQPARTATPELGRLLDRKEAVVSERTGTSAGEAGNGVLRTNGPETEPAAPAVSTVAASSPPVSPARRSPPPDWKRLSRRPHPEREEAGMSRLLAAKRRAQQRQENKDGDNA